MKNTFYSIIFFLILFSCSTEKKNYHKNEESKKIVNSSQDSLKKYSDVFIPSKIDNEKGNSLFVFVGEKIDLKKLPHEERSMDSGFLAEYKIIKKVYGDFLEDTIVFKAYDHYGIPAFSEYNHVLLFVSFFEREFYHQKYQYFDVYKTKEGNWASPFSKSDYDHPNNVNTTIRPQKIEFLNEVKYLLDDLGNKEIPKEIIESLKENFPSPYYELKDKKAVAKYGNYVEDLFMLKRNGVLTSREKF